MNCLGQNENSCHCNYGNSKTETEAVRMKQTCCAEVEAVEAGKIISTTEVLRNYRGTTVTACIVSVKTKILATLRNTGEYIYSSEILLKIAKFRDCLSKVLVKIRS